MESFSELRQRHSDPVFLIREWFRNNLEMADLVRQLVKVMLDYAGSANPIASMDALIRQFYSIEEDEILADSIRRGIAAGRFRNVDPAWVARFVSVHLDGIMVASTLGWTAVLCGPVEDEISWMGGESIIIETTGLGGFAQAAAFPLQAYQGGSAETMVSNNLALYPICVGEHTDFGIPYLGYRGTPTGIDLMKVVESGVTPIMDIGIAGRNGGQIGAGLVRAHIGCFERAAAAYKGRYQG
jgi:hypothetical protein